MNAPKVHGHDFTGITVKTEVLRAECVEGAPSSCEPKSASAKGGEEGKHATTVA